MTNTNGKAHSKLNGSASGATSDPANIEESLSTAERLELETAQIPWSELQRYFAAGRVIAVDSSLDLIHVAERLHADDTTQFQSWTADELVAGVSDEQALAWVEADATLWAVVIRPWVLVQE